MKDDQICTVLVELLAMSLVNEYHLNGETCCIAVWCFKYSENRETQRARPIARRIHITKC